MGQPLLTGNNIQICATRTYPKTNHRDCSISNKNEAKELESTRIKTRTARVYDLLNAGPRHRFTVSGRLVSNCGYGMGASKFQATAKTYGIDIDFDLAQLAITTYRQTNKSIVDLWRFLDGMIPFMQKQAKRSSMIPQSMQTEQSYKCLTFRKEEIALPNGLALHYPDLRYEDDGYRYGHKQKTYAGAITENIVQALARIVISDQVRTTHKAGYPITLLVHDEIVCCVPETQAKQCSKDLHHIMCQPPDWAQDMPLDAEEVISPKYIKP